MAVLHVNPTRMELTRLKARHRTASRGHKLLKDKRDELMKQFLDAVRSARSLRSQVEGALQTVNTALTSAALSLSPEGLELALLYPQATVSLSVEQQSVMSVPVPRYTLQTSTTAQSLPYGFAETSGELDGAIEALTALFPTLLQLAQAEHTAQLLSAEIQRTRRRVNALEYVKLPQMEQTIHAIAMKLDENERSATIRLMKVKELVLKEAIQEKRAEDERVLAGEG